MTWIISILLFVLGLLLGGNTTLAVLWLLGLLSWASNAQIRVLDTENQRLRQELRRVNEDAMGFVKALLAKLSRKNEEFNE